MAGTLNLSRNLGLATGTCVLGAVFVAAAEVTDVTSAAPAAVASAARLTFAVAAVLTLAALAPLSRARSAR